MALTTVKSDQIQTSVALAGSPTTTTQSASDNSTKVATTAYVETAVANLVASAPAALNTLDELAAALNDDASFSTTVTNSIATKLPLAGGTLTGALTINHAGGLLVHDTNGTASNRLKFLYSGTSGVATLGPDSTGGNTSLVIGTSNSGTFTTALTINSSQAATFAGTLTGTTASFSTASTSASVFTLTDTGVAAYEVTFPDTGTYQLGTNTTSDKTFKLLNSGSGTFNLNVEGKVGIGGTGNAIDELLHIEKSAGTTLVKTEVAANSIVGFQITKTNATTQAWRIVDGQTVNGVLEFYDLTNSATRMAIKGDGSVGINETNPSGKLQITDGNNYAKFGDFHSNSTMTLQMADTAGFPVEMQAYSSELRFNTTPTSGATPVPRMHIQNDGHIRVNPGAADYDGHTNVDQHLFTVQTSYNGNGDQNLNIVNHNGNWQDGTSGSDSAYGLMWGYQNNIRAGIHYDHRGTEKFDFYSGYGSMRFRVRTSVAANQSPIGSETVMPPALTIIPGGNVGIGTARGGITPSASLHVAGENSGYDGTIRIGERGYLGHRDASSTKTWVANSYNNNSATFGIRVKGIADSDEVLTALGSGEITMPKQPYVQGRGNGGWTAFSSSGTWELQPHGSTPVTSLDRNSDYSTSNKRFTCPVDGVYLVCASWYIYQTAAASAGGQYLHPSVYKNGGLAWNSSMSPYTIYGYEIDRTGVSSKHYDGVQMTYTIYCSANDYLDIRCYTPNASTLSYENYFYFSYTLLS